MKKSVLLFIFLAGFALLAGAQQSPVTLTSLLNELVNPKSLTSYNGPQYSLKQVSSWDRSRLKGRDIKNWFANKDYDYYIRKEQHGSHTEYVILDAKGPGAITKWWIPLTLLGGRTVRVYLDNNPRPVIEENYDKLIGGSSFIKWPFAFLSSDEKDVKYQYSLPIGLPIQEGADLYLPLPFSKACKITLDDSVFYYGICYRMYKPGTKVVSFTKSGYYKNMALVKATGHKLLAANVAPANASQRSGVIAKGQSLEINLPAGPHLVNQLYLQINSKNNKQMNRATVLEVIADGKETVWSPVSEFFGGGVYARPVKNSKLEVTPDGWMISNWAMPYKTSAKIIIKNYGTEPVKAELKAVIKNYHWDLNSMYFHAGWHEEAPLNAPPFKDWTYIAINGKGRYVGDILTVYSGPHNWWGEGDEKIYINGETFPSQIGTGLEDYYGYAWGIANYFNSPFISASDRDARGKDNWSGYNTMGKMRLLDDIPFSTSLKVDIEAWIVQAGVSYSVTSFWYGKPGATSNIKPDEKAVTRELPDFEGMQMQELPGKAYADPAANKLLIGKAKGNISYAGDQLDLLDWKDNRVAKIYDGDKDGILGTAGFYVFADVITTMYSNIGDSIGHLPAFVAAIDPQHVTKQGLGTYLPVPGKEPSYHKTGLIEVPGNVAEKGLVSLTLGKDVPPSFRFGIMLDNADVYTKVGKYLWITDSRNGDSGKVRLVRSNRVPDWYFFDIKNLKQGDVITVHGSTEKDTDKFTIGALTFDINK